MGILDLFRGKKKEPSKLPTPTPVVKDKTKIPSDIAPIKPGLHKDIKIPENLPDLHKDIAEYPAPIIEIADIHDTHAYEPTPTTFGPDEPKAAQDVSHIFISSNEYAGVLDKANQIRSKLLETDERLQKLVKLRTTEAKELDKWESQLAGLEKKLTYMETVLDKGGEV